MTTQKKWNVAVIGATGLVGREMLSILEERKFPVKNLTCFASEQSGGKTISFQNKLHKVSPLTEESVELFKEIDIALMSAGGEVSRLYAPLIAKKGTVLIDNSNAWRMDPSVPLIVPEVNSQDIEKFRATRIIANPNCSTIQMVQVLKPLHDAFKLKRVIVSTYQSTSGAGKAGMDELAQQTVSLLNQQELKCTIFPHQIAFNCIPQIGAFLEGGYSLEETKMIQETQKILGDPSIRVTATCVRVPTFSSHSESINIETVKKVTAHEARTLLSKTRGVKVLDDPQKNHYPLGCEVTTTDETWVGRIRDDQSVEHGLNLWVVSDNLRKGAALNAVQIAEALISEYL